MDRIRVLILVTVLNIALGAVPAGAEDTRISPNPTARNVNAFGDVIVYTRRIETGWVLVRRANGRNGDVPGIAPSNQPIDADLGPGPHGGVVAIYQRCLSGEKKRCPLFTADMATNRETPIPLPSRKGCSFSDPSVYGTTVLLAAYCGGDGWMIRRGGRWRTLAGPGGTDNDLSRSYAVVSAGGNDSQDIWAQPLSGRRGRTIFRDNGELFDVDVTLHSLRIVGRYVYFVDEGSGENGHDSAIQRVALRHRGSALNAGDTDRAREFGDDEKLKPGVLDSFGFLANGDLAYARTDPDLDEPRDFVGIYLAATSTVRFTR